MKVQLRMSWWASEKSLDAEFLPEKFLEAGFLSEKSLETGFLPEKPMKAGFLSEKSHMLTELQIELSWLALFQRCVYFPHLHLEGLSEKTLCAAAFDGGCASLRPFLFYMGSCSFVTLIVGETYPPSGAGLPANSSQLSLASLEDIQ